MKRFGHFSFLIGIALFFLLLRTVDLGSSVDLFKRVQVGWLIAAFLFVIPEILLKSLRLRALASRFHSHLSLKSATWIYLSGQPLAAVTPAKLGDIARVLGLSRAGGLSLTTALSVHVADKVCDIFTLAILACVGLINLIIQSQNQTPALAALLGILAGILFMALFLNPSWMRSILKPLVLSLAPEDLSKKLHAHGQEFYHHLLEIFTPFRRAGGAFLLSFLAWEVTVVRAYFCALALGIPLSVGNLALLLPVVIVVELLPISILGFGTREAALFLFFTSTLVTHSALISFSLLTILVGPLSAALLGLPAAMKLSVSGPRKP